MAIHTDRPGGGDDRVSVYRANSADEARRARTALEKANVPVELPDQAIDAVYATNPKAVLHVKVALKHSAAALKAISDAIPREEEPVSPIMAAEDRNKAAAATLAPEPAREAIDTSVWPVSAVDKSSRRALTVAFMSTLAPPMGFLALVWAVYLLIHMSGRPNDTFSGKNKAKLAALLGGLIGILGTPFFVALMKQQLNG